MLSYMSSTAWQAQKLLCTVLGCSNGPVQSTPDLARFGPSPWCINERVRPLQLVPVQRKEKKGKATQAARRSLPVQYNMDTVWRTGFKATHNFESMDARMLALQR